MATISHIEAKSSEHLVGEDLAVEIRVAEAVGARIELGLVLPPQANGSSLAWKWPRMR